MNESLVAELIRRIDALEARLAELGGAPVATVDKDTSNTFSQDQVVQKANAALRVGVDANNYFEILASSANYTILRQLVQSGNGLLDIEPRPLDGSGQAQFRFFRNTNTTGACYFDVLIGTNTNTLNARIGGKGVDSFLCGNNGNLGIGATTTPAQKVDVTGNGRIRGFLQLTDGVTAPSAASGFGALYIDSADGDLKVRFGDGVTKTIATDT